jgi:hypothetical protein
VVEYVLRQDEGHPAGPWRKSPRPMSARVPAGAHILSHNGLRTIARHFAGRDDPVLGEELLPFVLHHKMLDADCGRIIPREVLAELGDGDPSVGRRVLVKFISNMRNQEHAGHYKSGGAVKVDKADAGYHDSADSGTICAICRMYRPENKCSAVTGFISRTGSCRFFEKA